MPVATGQPAHRPARSREGEPAELPQLSYVAFVSPARNQATGALGHVHWFAYTEDPAGVPGEYGDAVLARITREQTFTKRSPGQTRVRETITVESDRGVLRMSVTYDQGGLIMWVTADAPTLPLLAARNPRVVRWYQEDQVLDVVHSEPLDVNRVSELGLDVRGELVDVFDGDERVVATVIQRPYLRRVHVPGPHRGRDRQQR